jgi:translocation and assembly module TamB
MDPIGAPIETSPKKKGYLGRQPRMLRVSMWISSGILAVVVLFVFAAAIVLHSTVFHNYVLNKARALASEQLGTRVDLQNFALHLSTLSLDIYGLTVYGAEPYPDPSLLQIQHAQAGVRIVSILHRKWYLDSLRIDGPVAKIFTDANGNSNIPKLKSSGSKVNTSVFDLGIRHAALTNGEVYYNDKHSSVAADLQAVEFRTMFDAALQKYSGTLSYKDGQLTAGSLPKESVPKDGRRTIDAYSATEVASVGGVLASDPCCFTSLL